MEIIDRLVGIYFYLDKLFGSPLARSSFLAAADRGDIVMIDTLVENGININSKDACGCTALMKAAYRGHLDVVKYLVENGADINAKDKGGLTVFEYANCSENKEDKQEIIEYLNKISK